MLYFMILLHGKLFNVKNIESHKMMKQQIFLELQQNILEVMERCLILMLLIQIQQIQTRLR